MNTRDFTATILLGVLLLGIGVSASPCVEGAGTYRGAGVILPYWTHQNRGQIRTFFRFTHGFASGEDQSQGEDAEIHLIYFCPGQDPLICDEFNHFFPVTVNDYALVSTTDGIRVGNSRRARAPRECPEGYAVATLVVPGDTNDNALAADEFTVDLQNGWAWGVPAVSFRGEGPPHEDLNFPENFFPTLISGRLNVQGVGSEGTTLYIVPLSTPLEPPLLEDFFGPNRYRFDRLVYDSTESSLSLGTRSVECFARMRFLDLVGAAGRDHLAQASGEERQQGWLRMEGQGRQTITRSGHPDLLYYNRAIAVQVDSLVTGRWSAVWALYPTHNRTTAELNPDPSVYNASGAGGATAIDPNGDFTYP